MKRNHDGSGAPTALTRRAFVKYGVALPSTTPFVLRSTKLWAAAATTGRAWPQYLIRRERDELFLQLTAVGYVEIHSSGYRSLSPIPSARELFLIFTFPPQHFA